MNLGCGLELRVFWVGLALRVVGDSELVIDGLTLVSNGKYVLPIRIGIIAFVRDNVDAFFSS